MGLQEKEKKNSLREQMPCVAALIDELRNVFGEEEMNKQIRQGMAGKPVFHASENGHEIGTAFTGGIVISGADLVIKPKTDDAEVSRRKSKVLPGHPR